MECIKVAPDSHYLVADTSPGIMRLRPLLRGGGERGGREMMRCTVLVCYGGESEGKVMESVCMKE